MLQIGFAVEENSVYYNKMKYTKKQEQVVCREYLKTFNTYKVVENLNIPLTSVSRILRRNNIKRQSREDAARKYKIDELSFSKKDQNYYYWIGFIFADGYIGRDKSLISISSIDKEHLQKFLNYVQSDVPIKKCKNQYGEWYRISIKSKTIYQKLISVGITTNKSTTENPSMNLINNRHFWRGIIDGDGGVRLRKEPNPKHNSISLYLCGSNYICKYFTEYIKNRFGYDIKYHAKGTIFSIEFSGKKAKKVIRKLYRNSKTYLDRKMVKINNIDPSILR